MGETQPVSTAKDDGLAEKGGFDLSRTGVLSADCPRRLLWSRSTTQRAVSGVGVHGLRFAEKSGSVFVAGGPVDLCFGAQGVARHALKIVGAQRRETGQHIVWQRRRRETDRFWLRQTNGGRTHSAH